MPKVSEPSNSPVAEWLDNPWKTTITALITCGSLIGIGYTCASHFLNQDFKIEKIELKQEYGQKIQNAINDCRDGKMKSYEDDMHEIKESVKKLGK